MMRLLTPLLRGASIFAVFVAATGCIVSKRDDTVYVHEDGSLTWLVIERNIRSDKFGDEGIKEESEYMARVPAGEYQPDLAFDRLSGRDRDCRIIRERRPYAILCEASFDSVLAVGWEFVRITGFPGNVEFVKDGDTRRLQISLRVEGESTASERDKETLGHLLSGIDSLELVFDHGQIKEAHGFSFEKDGSIARFDPGAFSGIDPKVGADVLISITWAVPAGSK